MSVDHSDTTDHAGQTTPCDALDLIKGYRDDYDERARREMSRSRRYRVTAWILFAFGSLFIASQTVGLFHIILQPIVWIFGSVGSDPDNFVGRLGLLLTIVAAGLSTFERRRGFMNAGIRLRLCVSELNALYDKLRLESQSIQHNHIQNNTSYFDLARRYLEDAHLVMRTERHEWAASVKRDFANVADMLSSRSETRKEEKDA